MKLKGGILDTAKVAEGSAADVGLPAFDDTSRGIYLLPLYRVDGKQVLSTNTSAVAKLLRRAGLASVEPHLDGEIVYRDERSLSWLGPVLFVSIATMADNPQVVSVALGVISNYVTELFKGKRADETTAKLDLIVERERGRSYTRVSYHGPVSGISTIERLIKSESEER